MIYYIYGHGHGMIRFVELFWNIVKRENKRKCCSLPIYIYSLNSFKIEKERYKYHNKQQTNKQATPVKKREIMQQH